MNSRKVTRKDVAKHAGVSTAVVSYVINNKQLVKEETRQRVLQSIQELGYHPNPIARSLKTNRVNQLAVLVNYLGNPFEAGLLIHIENYAVQHGFIVSFHSYVPQQEFELIHQLLGRVDGIILIGQQLEWATLNHLQEANVPVTSITRLPLDAINVPSIDLDWEQEMHKLVGHLKDNGHTNIAFMESISQRSHPSSRLSGFLKAMRTNELEFNPENLLYGKGRFEEAEQQIDRYLQAPTPVTSIICANDLMALGVLSACRKNNISVPKQLAVAGCEDILMAKHASPPLTTIRYPRLTAGEEAVALCIKQLEESIPPSQADYKISLQGELVIRSSTKQLVE